MANANRDKGLRAERELVKWLRLNGFPHAERSIVTGYRHASRQRFDGGDITGTPSIIWSVKDCAREYIHEWWGELTAMAGTPQDIRLLIQKRKGHANPGEWWCWLPLAHLAPGATGLIRVELRHWVPELRKRGYGEPWPETDAA